MDLESFARALRLRWPWHEWRSPHKLWVGFGKPCSDNDMALFYAATKITIGNGATADFWRSPWLLDQCPLDIAPDIFHLCKRKNWTVLEALTDNAWVSQINLTPGISVDHLAQFTKLWAMTQDVALDQTTMDSISWHSTSSGEYSASSAYLLQFVGSTHTLMDSLVWRAWAPPKYKFFAWLIIQDRVWTAARLQRRGWPNCVVCPLCRQEQETGIHLLFHCRFSIRIWNVISLWLGSPQLGPDKLVGRALVFDCWTSSVIHTEAPRKATASIVTLVAWKLWNERNSRIFRHMSHLPSVIIVDIKEETRLWVKAGAKCLMHFIPGE